MSEPIKHPMSLMCPSCWWHKIRPMFSLRYPTQPEWQWTPEDGATRITSEQQHPAP